MGTATVVTHVYRVGNADAATGRAPRRPAARQLGARLQRLRPARAGPLIARGGAAPLESRDRSQRKHRAEQQHQPADAERATAAASLGLEGGGVAAATVTMVEAVET